MTRFSACIEMLFVPETDDPAQCIRLAKAAGLEAVEFWFWSNKLWITSSVSFTKSVSASNKRHSFFIIHSHASKSFPHITT